MNHDDIVTRMGEIKTELLPLAEADSLEGDQLDRYNTLREEFEGLDGKRAEAEKFAERRQADLARLRKFAPNPKARETFERDPLGDPTDVERVSVLDNPWDLDVVSRTKNPDEILSRALSAAEMTSGPNDDRRQALTRLLERAVDPGVARIMLATTSPAYKTAYGKLARSGGDIGAAHLTAAELKAVEYSQEIARAVTTTDANGGYLVPTDIEPSVTLSTDGTNNPIWEGARRVQTTGDTYRVVSAPHAAWSWDGEAAEVSDDTPTFSNTDIPLYFAQGFVPVSIAGNQSISNVTQVVSDVLMGGWNDLVGSALTTGSGSSQPTGLVTALAGSGSEVPSDTTDTFAVADVYALYEALPARHRRNATWQGNIAAIADIRQFATDDGHALLARLGDGPVERLLGRPLVENEDMDASIDALSDNYYLLFGDLSHYVIAEGIGSLSEFIPHVFGSNGRPIGARGFYMASRFGADSVLDGGFRLLNVT